MPKKSLEEIVNNIWLQARNMGDATDKEYIDVNIRAIRDYYLAKLKLLKGYNIEPPFPQQYYNDNHGLNGADYNEGYKDGRNQAIAEMQRAIEEG